MQSINEGEATEVTPLDGELSEDGKTLTLTVEEVAQTDVEQSVVYTVNEVAAEAFVVEAVGEVAVESVSAINLTEVEVQFNQAVEEFSKSDLVVTDEDGEKQYIKSVTLAEDGKSATVEFYNELVNDTTYTFTATIGEVVTTATLDFVVGEPTTIELADQTVAPGKVVAYKVLDENGLDITLNVYVGSLQVFEDTFKVTDNRVAPEFTITSNDLEIDNIADIVMFNTLFEEIVVLPTGVTIEDVDFVSNNTAVITDNDSNEEGTVASTQNGETIICVDTITVVDNKGTDTEEDDETYVLTLDETFNVSVNITDNYDEFEVVANAQDTQNAVAEGGVAIFGSDIVVEKEELVGSGYGKTGIAQTNLGVIDGNGKTLSVEGASNSTWDSAIYTKGGTIKNVTINSGFRGIFIDASKGDVVVDNVIIDGTTYAISSDNGGNNKLTVTNSTLNGWTSFARTHSEVSFTNCNFGKSNGYAYLRPYSSTTLTDCEFSAGFALDSRHATITLKNCKVDGTLVTTENVIELLGANAGNVTIEN